MLFEEEYKYDFQDFFAIYLWLSYGRIIFGKLNILFQLISSCKMAMACNLYDYYDYWGIYFAYLFGQRSQADYCPLQLEE